MKRKIGVMIVILIVIIIGIIFIIKSNEKLTIEEITGINFDDISYIKSDREGIDTDLKKFRDEYENKVYQKHKKNAISGTIVAYKIYCYDVNNNIICTIFCNGHGFYFVTGEKTDYSNEILYDYGKEKNDVLRRN